MPSEDNFKSLNVETGLLEDIDEIRHLAVDLAQIIQGILKQPVIRIVVPHEVREGMAAYSVKAESIVRPMSQHEQYLLMNQAMGTPPEIVRLIEESVGGLSDTLPGTHPLVRGHLMHGILNSPDLPEDIKEVARKEAKAEEDANIELPPSIDNFLRGLMNKED